MSHFDHMSADPEKNGTNFVSEKSGDAGVVVRGVDSPEGTVHRKLSSCKICLVVYAELTWTLDTGNLKARHLQCAAYLASDMLAPGRRVHRLTAMLLYLLTG